MPPMMQRKGRYNTLRQLRTVQLPVQRARVKILALFFALILTSM